MSKIGIGTLEARRGRRILWGWSHRWLCMAVWVMGTYPRSSGGAWCSCRDKVMLMSFQNKSTDWLPYKNDLGSEHPYGSSQLSISDILTQTHIQAKHQHTWNKKMFYLVSLLGHLLMNLSSAFRCFISPEVSKMSWWMHLIRSHLGLCSFSEKTQA